MDRSQPTPFLTRVCDSTYSRNRDTDHDEPPINHVNRSSLCRVRSVFGGGAALAPLILATAEAAPPVRVIELQSPTNDEHPTRGFGINNNGDVVGQLGVTVTVGGLPVDRDHAGLWLFTSRFGFGVGVHNLTTEAGLALPGRANDINTYGVAVGAQQLVIDSQPTERPFVWDLTPEDYVALAPFCDLFECGSGGSA